jgi:hypothetical protein
MSDDSMSTSHPIYKSVNSAAEIVELFDSIETTKATAILRMADYYMERTVGSKYNTLSNVVVREQMSSFFFRKEIEISYLFLVFSLWTGIWISYSR